MLPRWLTPGRKEGRPVLICGQRATSVRDDFLKDHLDLAKFTFLDVPTEKILNIPEGPYIHPHTDLWMHRESKYRQTARTWIKQVIRNESETVSNATHVSE